MKEVCLKVILERFLWVNDTISVYFIIGNGEVSKASTLAHPNNCGVILELFVGTEKRIGDLFPGSLFPVRSKSKARTRSQIFCSVLGFNIPILTNYLVDRAGKIADFIPEVASPVKASLKIHQPILLVHGTNDQRIDITYARQNFQSLASQKKVFRAVTGANHLNVWEVGGEAYFEEVAKFLKTNSPSVEKSDSTGVEN